ncbi:MmpS family transport accessory protein [Micromonospora sp. Llam0]|uniref:MmpS family transport accessory protein n=1 Tax=Micromonospora sp. Llam0 TaxID=2485143 RepID=UPI000F4AED3A
MKRTVGAIFASLVATIILVIAAPNSSTPSEVSVRLEGAIPHTTTPGEGGFCLLRPNPDGCVDEPIRSVSVPQHPAASIEFEANDSETSEKKTRTLPWTRTGLKVDSLAVTARLTNRDPGSRISCSIIMDGKTLVKNSSRGSKATVQCLWEKSWWNIG